ncbi:hypothetical protein CAPTEDRAFT_192400 [Capitella teleta]|uniref:Acyl-ACP thioesterase-like C-terminal domain-containing protein n=2 Tax=Capitella teleta TaxID=283909 RepID=R7TUK9_CAPTE|nr:hypothetical protein CAPTEDRAFT_192400 [Capitella teleta]|eukprot:ELT97262.1 hypothetical protein CAPTEDRAFT_192400 [Capitella teleta]
MPAHAALSMAYSREQKQVDRLVQLKISVNEDGSKATVSLPGYSLDDIDRTGNVSVSRIQRLLSAVRIAAYHTPNLITGVSFLEYDTLTSDCLTFMASTKTEVSRDLYTLVNLPELPALQAEIQLGYVGTSSLNSIALLRNKANGHVLAQNVNQVVTVDKVKRKPTPIPDWWKTKYVPVVSGNQRLIVAPLQIPDKVYDYQIHVAWSDIDGYGHTNYVCYIRYCLDSAMDAVKKNYFSKFEDDILLYHVKDMQISYRGESAAGDVLSLKAWEDESNPYHLYFDIASKGKTIFQCGMLFHEPHAGLARATKL